MANILVFLQADAHGGLSKASLVALEGAKALKSAWSKGDLLGLALGEGAKKISEQAASFGLTKVFYSEKPELAKYLADSYTQATLAALDQGSADVLVAAATSTGRDLLPRVAAKIGAAQASEILAVNSDGSLRRPMYAGNAFADVELLTEKRVVTVRTTAFAPAASSGSTAEVIELNFGLDITKSGEVVSLQMAKADRPELGDAEVVVSGGRALGSKEKFEEYIMPLADTLNAAIGASRAAVDAGYAPNDWQVGQTGKIVAPNLYIAIGISGAIQHLAGMKDSKVIVAINKDPEAPIFELADYGLVADLFTAVPEINKLIQEAKG